MSTARDVMSVIGVFFFLVTTKQPTSVVSFSIVWWAESAATKASFLKTAHDHRAKGLFLKIT